MVPGSVSKPRESPLTACCAERYFLCLPARSQDSCGRENQCELKTSELPIFSGMVATESISFSEDSKDNQTYTKPKHLEQNIAEQIFKNRIRHLKSPNMESSDSKNRKTLMARFRGKKKTSIYKSVGYRKK